MSPDDVGPNWQDVDMPDAFELPSHARAIELADSGVQLRVGSYWDGRLDDWIQAVRQAQDQEHEVGPDEALHYWSFPTQTLATEYLALAPERDEDEVMAVLRSFLFRPATFEHDADILYYMLHNKEKFRILSSLEYGKRLLRTIANVEHAQPGVRWVIDLLPDSPFTARDVIRAYLKAHIIGLAGGRRDGLHDAIALIEARWIRGAPEVEREHLLNLSPRDFERLIARLYREMGYSVQLTPPQKDGGRDVLALRLESGRRHTIFIECKLYTEPVGVRRVRELAGVVSTDRASSGVLVTSSRFTKPALLMAANNPRLELVDGEKLLLLLNEYLGPNWWVRLGTLLWSIGD
ncbi:restriction endonuclease [Pseudonocardia humida]|uniref:Restriction endonuclease n=1 Tax=Pseudonocardia humida TaxID=2800819 RepID=A0ABT1A2Y8_9PSEU|nr:restriction endonuclease [Pseudonocardia humida]MCO1657353.1 restriction endonuclease [Pseudonocardia humida]